MSRTLEWFTLDLGSGWRFSPPSRHPNGHSRRIFLYYAVHPPFRLHQPHAVTGVWRLLALLFRANRRQESEVGQCSRSPDPVWLGMYFQYMPVPFPIYIFLAFPILIKSYHSVFRL